MTTPSLTNDLLEQLRASSLGPLSQQLGVSEEQTDSAMTAALPLLLGALGGNAQNPAGAQALFGALQRDHQHTDKSTLQGGDAGGFDVASVLGALVGGGSQTGGAAGGLGGLLGGLLGGSQPPSGEQLNGGGILDHILGNKTAQVEGALGQATGLSSANISKLLTMLAPIVMAYLGRQVSTGKLSSPDELGQVLGQEKAQAQQQGGIAGGLLGAVFDQNGDGKLDMGDLLKLGGQFLNRR
ncbi:DUF937 domain-containing protein [Lampropedia aestuarii]|uniref:DUF937 domain-containing protein n=1 Tax=Lampropedia aestuarii TaxID=2562762 RepID=A0A4S5BPH1_9BURK|nr:DUF937 domain-containing protein [Lampropedia aestuarii]MDH5858759.1 DUF937 domain-containing protein [Lampropedia aestuarii]THJ34597.1 DUF937 domain-containing protein [Lampropedia aestuarii]